MATTETTIGTATVRVWPSGQVGEYGKAGWAYSIRDRAADGAVTTIATGDELYGWGDGAEMLRSLCSFLAADAERYRRVMGPITDGQVSIVARMPGDVAVRLVAYLAAMRDETAEVGR